MTCTELADLLDPYLDGALGEEARGCVERHLLRCPDCAFEARSLEQSRALLRETCPPCEAPPAFREKMAARLHDAFADGLRAEPAAAPQWELPFARGGA